VITTRNSYKILIDEPEGKKPFVRPRWRGEDNIKTDLKDIGQRVNTGLIILYGRVFSRLIREKYVGLCVVFSMHRLAGHVIYLFI
jgi:hypothetical protein